MLRFRKWQMVMAWVRPLRVELKRKWTKAKMLDNGNLYTYDEWKVHEKYTVNNSDKEMQPRKKVIKSFICYSQE